MTDFKFSKKAVGILIASLFVLGVLLIPVDNNTVATEPEVAQTADVVEPATPQSDVDVNAIVEIFKEDLGDSFVDYTYEDGVLTIDTKFDGIAEELIMYGITEDWYLLTDTVDQLTYGMYDQFDIDVVVNVLNDANTDNVLYSSMNGIGIYDVAGDFE